MTSARFESLGGLQKGGGGSHGLKNCAATLADSVMVPDAADQPSTDSRSPL